MVLHHALAWVEALANICLAAWHMLCVLMPSLVVKVHVAISKCMEKGQAIFMLKSMKIEMVLQVPVDGIIKAIGCIKGKMVEEGGELVDIEESKE
jgi:biotin carboxyl carrier protein